jgi:hypothetical protein
LLLDYLNVLSDLLGMMIIIPSLLLHAVSFGANTFTMGFLGAAFRVNYSLQ